MKTILVPVDFSDSSRNAMDYAILLAKKLKMRLLLLHAFHPSLIETISNSYKIAAHKIINGTPQEKQDELRIWREAVTSSEKNLECNTLFIEGDLSEEIAKLAEEDEIDLVVMGTKGATGLKKVFIGSNTANVIEQVACPVIAVPGEFQFDGLKKIIFATDYHDSDVASICFVIKLATLFDSELTIIHLADGELKPSFEKDLLDYFKEQIEKSITYDKMKFHLLEGADVNKSLNEFIKEQKADLLAISTRDRTLTGPILNRGVTRKMADHVQIPLLVFHAFDIGDKDFF